MLKTYFGMMHCINRSGGSIQLLYFSPAFKILLKKILSESKQMYYQQNVLTLQSACVEK